MLVLSLIASIAELFLIMLCGAVLIRVHLVSVDITKPLSKILLYFFIPCMLFSSFQKTLTRELIGGLVGAFLFAIVIHAIFIVIGLLMRRLWKATVVEEASVVFTNCGNILIPIIAGTLGEEWIIYASAYIAVFNILFWTYGIRLFKSDEPFQIKHFIENPSLIALMLGMFTLFTGIRLPAFLLKTLSDVGNCVGPFSIMITGMVIGSMDLTKFFANRRIFGVLLMRMLVCPAIVLLLIKITGIQNLVPNGHGVILISLLGASAPCSGNVNQMAILYDKDAEYSSVISITSTLMCIITLPLVVWLYEII